MSSSNSVDKKDNYMPITNITSPLSGSTPQVFPETPWLVRAKYFLKECDMKTLGLPGAEGLYPENPVYFSRPFLSQWLGGSQHPAFTYVNPFQNDHHVYNVKAYYVGTRDWNPQYPKKPGENGAILLVGKPLRKPSVPWSKAADTPPVGWSNLYYPLNCFVRKSSAEHEYIGHYVFHGDFKMLTREEVQLHIPDATKILWIKRIDTTRWGSDIKGSSEARTAAELFELPDEDRSKLCFYWTYMEYIGYDKGLYDALYKKGQEIGWTSRQPHVSKDLPLTTRAAEEDSTVDMEIGKTGGVAMSISDDEEPFIKAEQPEAKSASEGFDQRPIRQSSLEEKARC